MSRLITTIATVQREQLRLAIATDIYRAAQHAPMTLAADGGELAHVLAERIIRRVEDGDIEIESPRSLRKGLR